MAQPTPCHQHTLTGRHGLAIQLPCHSHIFGGHQALEGGILPLQYCQALQLHDDLHHPGDYSQVVRAQHKRPPVL